MNTKDLVRDSKRVLACLQELPDESLVALKELKVYLPVRFSERGLAHVGVETIIVGLFAIVCENKYYGVMNVNTMIKMTPSSMLKIKIKGEDFFEFTFDAGSVVIPSLNLVRDDIVVYKIYDEVISKGHVPWYLDYETLGHIFDTAGTAAGANIGENSEVTELIVSIIARNPENKSQYYRTLLSTPEDLRTLPVAFIPLKSVIHGATNTTNKLTGSYWSVGAVSALVNPSTRTERIEGLLRQ